MSAAGQRVTCRPFYSCVPSFPVLYLSILSAVSFEQPSSVFRLPIYKRRPSVTLSYNLYRCYDAYTAAGNHLFFCSGQCTLPMDDFQTGEEASFIAGEVKNIVKEVLLFVSDASFRVSKALSARVLTRTTRFSSGPLR
ncbi:unnamed protein product [Dicrocoelium dendriticum]|nr:unnamed protein product [Dicrocoelium dendriticum]